MMSSETTDTPKTECETTQVTKHKVSFGQKETLIIDEVMNSTTDADNVNEDDTVLLRNGYVPDVTSRLIDGGGDENDNVKSHPCQHIHYTTKPRSESRVTFSEDEPETSLDHTSHNHTSHNDTSHSHTPTVIVMDQVTQDEQVTKALLMRRSTSMESRDNPFTPEGDLSKETDELMRHSIVIRDQFIMSADEEERTEPVQTDVVCEEMVTVSVSTTQNVQATPNSVPSSDKQRQKQNGKVDDTKPVDKSRDGTTTPDGLHDSTKTPDKKQNCCAIL